MKKKLFSVLISVFVLIGLFVSSGNVFATSPSSTITADEIPEKFIDPVSMVLLRDQQSPEKEGVLWEGPVYRQSGTSDELFENDSVDSQSITEFSNEGVFIKDGLYYREASDSVQLSGTFLDETKSLIGPDQFGYTAESEYTYTWVDVSSGTDTGINDINEVSGPIDIGFDFKFYANTYSQLYISRHGFISFDSIIDNDWQSTIPNPEIPNNVIGPMWVPSADVNYVRYNVEGDAGDQKFIVEWNDLYHDPESPDIYSFEMILHESGDIVFQYKSIATNLPSACASSGIEDSAGFDGLTIKELCGFFESETAARIFRPLPSARVYLYPLEIATFAKADEDNVYEITIGNSGEFGTDTYDLTTNSTWPLAIFADDGITALVDTDSDGIIDTGPINQGEYVTIIAKTSPPPTAEIGDSNTAFVTTTSSLDTAITKTAVISSVVPAPFVQIVKDGYNGVSYSLIHPNTQNTFSLEAYTYEENVSIAETISGSFVFTFTNQICTNIVDNNCVEWEQNISYGIRDRTGKIIKETTTLSLNLGEYAYKYNYAPVVAVSSSGNIGLAWVNEIYDDSIGLYNRNVFFAVLDPFGNIIHSPENLTNNDRWGNTSNRTAFGYETVKISTTDTNKFLLAWVGYEQTVDSWIQDIYYKVHGANGSQLVSTKKLTSSVAGVDWNNYPALTQLSGDKAFISWRNTYYGTQYIVLDSAGSTIKPITDLDGMTLRNPDTIQLSDGTILLAGHNSYDIYYALIDGATYTTKFSLTQLLFPGNSEDNAYVSVTRDEEGHGILTWMGNDNQDNLYYSLVDNNGNVITDPIAFYQAQGGSFGGVQTSPDGYGNTTYSDTFVTYKFVFLPFITK